MFKALFCVMSFCCLALAPTAALSEGPTVNNVSFSCTATPKTNINGVPSASLVEVLVTSEAAKRMTMKSNVIITSDKGRSYITGHNNGQLGKPIMPQGSYKLPFEPFGKVGPQDEFPKTCQIVDLQVCPYYPNKVAKPTAAGAASYYDAFHQGEPAEGCRNAVNLSPVDLPIPSVSSGCFALELAYSGNSSYWYQKGGTFNKPYWVRGAASKEDAINQAIAKAVADGFKETRDPSLTYGAQCSKRHGAVVSLLKPWRVNNNPVVYQPIGDGVYDYTTVKYGATKAEAEQSALTECATSMRISDPYSIYAKAGIGSCTILDSW